MKIIRGDQIEFIPAAHEDPANPGVLKRVLATRDDLDAGRVQMLNWARLDAGNSFQLHYHEDMQEVFVILNGQVSMVVDDGQYTLHGGDAILIDSREVHQMTNHGEAAVDYLVFGIAGDQNGKTIVV